MTLSSSKLTQGPASSRRTTVFAASLWCSALLLVAAWPAAAHSDPIGDVHPTVIARAGRFEVYFTNNQRSNLVTEKPIYRIVFTPDGKLALPRTAVAELPKSVVRLRETFPATLDLNGKLYDFKYARKYSGAKPYCEQQGGGKERITFTYPDHDASDIVAAAQGQKSIALLVSYSEVGPDGAPKTDRRGLHLYEFDPKGGRARRSAAAGVPFYIYNFPRCSPLIFHKGHYYFSWAAAAPGEEEGAQLNVSSWDARTGQLKTRALSTDIYWNTSISMAAHADRLFMAWHFDDPALGVCRIFNVTAPVQ